MPVDISLVIVNHQTAGDVACLLGSLREHHAPGSYQAIVVNTVARGAFAKRGDQDHVQVLQLDRNRGFAAAVNQGIAAATGEFLLPMNADLFFTDNSLPRLVTHLRAHPEAGIIIPRLLSANGELQYNARTFYTWFVIFCRRSPGGKLFQQVSRRHLMMDRDHSRNFAADWGLGAALCVRRELLRDGRLYDERFFMYFEDVDLCARAWKQGRRVEYFPAVTLIHSHRRESAVFPGSRHGRIHLASLWKFWRKHGALRPEIAS